MTDLLRRRHAVAGAIALGATALGATTLGTVPGARADAPPPATPMLSKASVGYRDVPYQGKVCAQCVYFVFKPVDGGNVPTSRCQLVAGPINPAGWCQVWAPKSA